MRPGQRAFSDDDLAYMRAHWKSTPAAAIAQQLGRTIGTIYVKASAMGLRKIRGPSARKPRLERAPAASHAPPVARTVRPFEPNNNQARLVRAIRGARDALQALGLDADTAATVVGAIALGQVPGVRIDIAGQA